MSEAGIKIMSAGSTVFGARAALAARPDLGGIQVTTDHGHDIHGGVIAGTIDADIIIIPSDMLADLHARELLADAPRNIGFTGIGYAVRQGQIAPQISNDEALHAAIAAAGQIFLTTAPTGLHMLAQFGAIGLGDAVQRKLRSFERATEMPAALAGESHQALAFGPTTELMAWRDRGIVYGGAVPAAFDLPLPYGAAVLKSSPRAQAALPLLDFLAGAQGLAHFRNTGVS